MSLINKMLQDLDARGTAGADPMQGEIRPVAKRERRLPLPVALVSLASAVSLAAGGYAVVRYLQHRGETPAKPAVAALPPAPVVNPRPAAAPVVPAVPAEPTPAAPPTVAQAPTAAPQPEAPAAKPVAVETPARSVNRTIIRPDTPMVVHPPAAKAEGARTMEMARITGNAEGVYRRALDAVNEGRIHDSVALLEEALRIDPRHEGARQTLVGLLIENNRSDEAMRHLQAGLAANPAQPSMAMLLARMQIERGASGVDTLLKTLPAAAGNADYHAFLAGALQREQRFREAAEQYQAALRRSPQNGVWLMGLGISLQGDGRDTDALAVFQRAKAVGNLSPELQGFVERKINTLSR